MSLQFYGGAVTSAKFTAATALSAKDYLNGNGSAESDAAVAAMVADWGSSKRALYWPPGTYLINAGQLTTPVDGLLSFGAGKGSTIIKKNSAGVLWDVSGTSTAAHRRNVAIRDLKLEGNDLTGPLLRSYHMTSLKCWNLWLYGNDGYGFDFAELWDSAFYSCDLEYMFSTTLPALSIRNSAAASGLGFSASDSSNALRFYDTRIESFRFGAIRIEAGTSNSANPHDIRFAGLKIETATSRGAFVHMANTVADVQISGARSYINGYDSGYSTPVSIYQVFSAGQTTLRDVAIVSGGDYVGAGVELWADSVTLDSVRGIYTTTPSSGNHINITGGTANLASSGITTSHGTAVGGTPTSFVPSRGVATDVQTFTGSGTWTKPVGAQSVRVQAWGGSGGGGSGRRGAAGTVRCGGGGGGSSAYVEMEFPASVLTGTVAVTIGAAGTAGAARTANDTDGAAGGAGGTTTFGTYVKAGPGSGGGGGTNAAGTAGSTSAGLYAGTAGGAANGSGGAGANAGGAQGASGGGAGGGITTGDAASAGGTGGTTALNNNAAGTSGAIATGGGAGTAGPAIPSPGTGGGGGGSSIVGVAGTGGAGGLYGGGGGGGGASLNGNNSGAGGAGVAGWLRVITVLGA